MTPAIDPVSWHYALSDFLRGISARAEKTQQFYRCQLRQLVEWATEQDLPLECFRARDYRAYTAHRAGLVSVRTQLHDANCAKVFFRFCRQNAYMPADPLADYEIPKPADPVVYMPSAAELQKLLAAIQQRWDPAHNPRIRMQPKRSRAFFRARDYGLTAMLIECGCRISEACDVHFSDVDVDNLQVKFCRTKNRTNRIVPITAALVEALEPWLLIRRRIERDRAGDASRGQQERCGEHLFLTIEGGRLAPETFSRAWRKYIEYAGGKHFTCHGVRHYTSTAMVRRNARSAQILLGHAHISTTMKYDHTKMDAVRADHEEVAPLGRILVNKRSEAQTRAKRKRVI